MLSLIDWLAETILPTNTANPNYSARFAGSCRKLIAIRFQAFIDATMSVKSTNSFSEKCRCTSSNTSSGTPACGSVTDSVDDA
jgi:hypothetical protein